MNDLGVNYKRIFEVICLIFALDFSGIDILEYDNYFMRSNNLS